MTIDPVLRKKIVLIKQIYRRALVASRLTHSAADRVLSVIGFDLATETALKAIVSEFETHKGSERTFPALLERAETLLQNNSVTLPLKKQVLHAHNLRNDAQHKATYPSIDEVNECRAYTRDFLSEIFARVWKLDFDKFALAEAVKHEKASQYLEEAEERFAAKDYRGAAASCSAAFQLVRGRLADDLTDRVDIWTTAFLVEKSPGKSVADEGVFHAFLRTRYLVVFQAVGIDLQDYLRYKRMTRDISVMLMADDGMSVNYLTDVDLSETECEFVMSFTADAILLIESFNDSVGKPFTRFA